MVSFHHFLASSPKYSRQIYASRCLASSAIEPLKIAMERLFSRSANRDPIETARCALARRSVSPFASCIDRAYNNITSPPPTHFPHLHPPPPTPFTKLP